MYIRKNTMDLHLKQNKTKQLSIESFSMLIHGTLANCCKFHVHRNKRDERSSLSSSVDCSFGSSNAMFERMLHKDECLILMRSQNIVYYDGAKP